jgi:hypothetical protein
VAAGTAHGLFTTEIDCITKNSTGNTGFVTTLYITHVGVIEITKRLLVQHKFFGN